MSLQSKQADVWPEWAFSEENWRWAQGILNSRMIWWDNGPHLVPMLDMINCRQGPAGFERRVHSTQRRGSKAVTLAPWPIAEGDQVFENYGQPNPTYFLYHGFTMEPNVHDCARLPWATAQMSPATRRRERVEISAGHRRKAADLRLWRDDFCINVDKGLDDFMAVARVMSATIPDATNLKTAQAVMRPVARRWELRALRQAAAAIQVHLDDYLPIPKELLSAVDEAYRRGPASSGGSLRLNAERHNLETDGNTDNQDAMRWLDALTRGRAAWAASSPMQTLPFRRRMAAIFREQQREILMRCLQELRKRRANNKPPSGADKTKAKKDSSESRSEDPRPALSAQDVASDGDL